LKHWNADVFQREPAEDWPFAGVLGRPVLPPVVIAEDGVHSEPRPEALQRPRPFARLDLARHPAMRRRIVAQENDQVRFEIVRLLRDCADAASIHPWLARMNVSKGGNFKPQTVRPARGRQAVGLDAKAKRFKTERIAARNQRAEESPAGTLEETASCQSHTDPHPPSTRLN